MNTEDKAEQLAITLTRETYSGQVSWKNIQPPAGLSKGTENFYPLYLETNYKGRTIGLFERRYKYFYDEHEYYWCEEFGMCIIGDYGAVVWEYSRRSPALANLFEAAREQSSGISGILDDLI